MFTLEATITRGNRRGERVVIHQYCNDWAILQDEKLVSLTSLSFTVGEASHRHVLADQGVGMMWSIFDADHFARTGRFKKVR